jgi:hypothetical protein
MAKLPQSTAAVLAGWAAGVVFTLATGALAAAKPPASKPSTTTQPTQSASTAAQQAAKEKLEFRKAVLAAMKPELEAIDARAEAIETKAAAAKKTFDGHTHELEMSSHGWVRFDTMLTSDHHDVVREPYLNDWVAVRDGATAGMTTKTTSKPK